MDIPVKGATYAMKARQILLREGIRGSVGKKSGRGGCSYYIKVPDRESERAWKLLRDQEIIH